MIKQFSAGDITIRPFKTFKNWQVQSTDLSGVDQFGRSTYFVSCSEVIRGKKIDTAFYPSGSAKYDVVAEPMTNGKYHRAVYSLTDAMFYKNPHNPMEVFGLESTEVNPNTGKKEVRTIHDRVVTLRLDHNNWGEKVVPESVHITDSSNPHETFEIYDDGMTNLCVSGSHFSTEQRLGAVPSIPSVTWNTASGQFYTVLGGVTRSISLTQAKNYLAMGMDVTYTEDSSSWTQATASIGFDPKSERFGQTVSAWYKYIAVGSPMDGDSLADQKEGYAALYKYDESGSRHRLVKRLLSPRSLENLAAEYVNDPDIYQALVSSSYAGMERSGNYEDGFGYSVSVHDDFLAIGAPTGSKCFDSGSNAGFAYVYDKNKGGSDNWGLINVFQGRSVDDQFGHAVSIDDDILAVGAPGVSGSQGAVYVYRLKRYMDDTYPCRSIPTSSFLPQSGSCGLPLIDATGSLIAGDIPTPYFVSGNFVWVLETELSSSLAAADDHFGWGLETNNDRILVGTHTTSSAGYATLFVCNYVSASLGDCPTGSWEEKTIFTTNTDLGDLDATSADYAVQTALSYNGFGYSVALNGDNMAIGSYWDKAFLPYNGASAALARIMGAVYFYHCYDSGSLNQNFTFVEKTFGDIAHLADNQFGRRVSIDGTRAAISTESDNTWRSGSIYTVSASYQSTEPDDEVLGRVSMYSLNPDFTWTRESEMRRNKEMNQPFNIFGRGLSLSSDFLVVGAPIVTIAPTASLFSASYAYTGSVFVYDLENYEHEPSVGNMFYKNGYAVITSTSSNYENIFTGTGSFGFDMTYQGTHTIFEHEYLVSVRPGEFNYSTNPSSLVQNALLFDVNGDGVFDFSDLDVIMRYLNKKRFYEDYVFDDNGFVLEQDNRITNWWANDVLLTESGDVLLQESDFAAYLVSSSFTSFTKRSFDYIEANLDKTGILDIDGNGLVNINDGAILVAYFTDKLTPTTLAQWLDTNSTRKYVTDISTYIGKYTGVQRFYTNPDFFSYQASSSYDATGSYLAPYITTIGLYDSGRLVGVAKLGRPIKNLIDWPINFIVRFDT